MEKLPRYMVAHGRPGKKTLWYWQPGPGLRKLGWRPVRLSDDIEEARREAEEVNAKVALWRDGKGEAHERNWLGGRLRSLARAMLRRTLSNAKARRLTVELNLADVELLLVACGGRCSVTRLPLSLERDPRYRRQPWVPSLDRIDSGQGYTVANCRIVCFAVNSAMNCWGEEVFKRIARAFRNPALAELEPVSTVQSHTVATG